MQEKNLEKTLEARDVTLLRALIHLSISRLREEGNIDIILFLGVNGRIYDSIIPERLDMKEYYLLNTFKANLYTICSQLKGKSMNVSVEAYKDGSLIISRVGEAAFLAIMVTRELKHEELHDLLATIHKWSIIINHIFQLKPLSGKEIEGYPEDIQKEFHKLSRQLFVESFAHTKQYRKNQKILEYLKKELQGIVGLGMVDEILTISFNEIGSAPQYMTDDLWPMIIDKIASRVKEIRGDMLADEYYKKWIRDVERIIKSFV